MGRQSTPENQHPIHQPTLNQGSQDGIPALTGLFWTSAVLASGHPSVAQLFQAFVDG
jgi:hypothetical protein